VRRYSRHHLLPRRRRLPPRTATWAGRRFCGASATRFWCTGYGFGC